MEDARSPINIYEEKSETPIGSFKSGDVNQVNKRDCPSYLLFLFASTRDSVYPFVPKSGAVLKNSAFCKKCTDFVLKSGSDYIHEPSGGFLKPFVGHFWQYFGIFRANT